MYNIAHLLIIVKVHGRNLPLQISLQRTEPLIWRRVLVPSAITFAKLHKVIQLAMGWTDSHDTG